MKNQSYKISSLLILFLFSCIAFGKFGGPDFMDGDKKLNLINPVENNCFLGITNPKLIKEYNSTLNHSAETAPNLYCSVDYLPDMDSGLGNLSEGAVLAADFYLGMSDAIILETLKVMMTGTVSTVTFTLYDGSYWGPEDNIILGPATIVPINQTFVGMMGDREVYEIELDLYSEFGDWAIIDKTHWVALTTESDEENYWVYSEEINNDTNFYYFDSNNQTWTDVQNFGYIADGNLSITGMCLNTIEQEYHQFNYYPNPTKDLLNIDSTRKIKTLEVFDLNGKLLRKIIPDSKFKTQIDTSTLPNGIYMFRATLENGEIETFKIVRE